MGCISLHTFVDTLFPLTTQSFQANLLKNTILCGNYSCLRLILTCALFPSAQFYQEFLSFSWNGLWRQPSSHSPRDLGKGRVVVSSEPQIWKFHFVRLADGTPIIILVLAPSCINQTRQVLTSFTRLKNSPFHVVDRTRTAATKNGKKKKKKKHARLQIN